MKTALFLACLLSGSTLASAATAARVVVHPARCPDRIEDRLDRRESLRDERFDRGPRDVAEDRFDRRESRRDRAVDVCPARVVKVRG